MYEVQLTETRHRNDEAVGRHCFGEHEDSAGVGLVEQPSQSSYRRGSAWVGTMWTTCWLLETHEVGTLASSVQS